MTPTVRVTLAHPAAMTADAARLLLLPERAWYLQIGAASEVKLSPGWAPLDHTVEIPAGHMCTLRAGPRTGPLSVRGSFRVDPAGRKVAASPALARLVIALAPSAAPPAVVAPPAPAPVAGTVTTTGADETLSEVALERVTSDAAYLREHGIALPPVVRVLGARVNSTGRENFSASHLAWEAKPRTIDALEEVRAVVRAEQRADLRVVRGGIELSEEGHLVIDGRHVPVEAAALRGLVGLFSDSLPGAFHLLEVLPPAERGELFRRQRDRSQLGEGEIRIRTRLVGPDRVRQAYAVVGTGYADRDADVLACDMIDALSATPGGREARGEVTYRPETSALTAEALWHANHVVDLACGDVFRGGVTLRSSDNGGGSIRIDAAFLRNLCYNLIILGKGRGATARIQHRGRTDYAARIARALRGALDVTGRFVDRWGYARSTAAVDAIAALRGSRKVTTADGRELSLVDAFREARSGTDAAGVLLGAVAELDHLDIPRRTDASVELLLRGWALEPGETLADIINAVTRVHEAAIPVETRERYERAAGALLVSA